MEQTAYEGPTVIEVGDFAEETGFWAGPWNELNFLFNQN